MSALPALPPVAQLGPKVIRILGCNPGHYTLQGTNTYLIGSPSSQAWCLFDVGQGIPEYVQHLEAALNQAGPRAQVGDIVLSHWHHDHVQGLGDVLTLLQKLGSPKPKIWKWPSEHDDTITDALSSSTDAFTPASSSSPLHRLDESTRLDSIPGAQVLHVPGHTTDSIALKLPDEKLLLTADTVLGHGTAVFEDLKDYMTSLEKLERAATGCESLLPGHGDVASPSAIRGYIDHRTQRENQVVEQLGTSDAGLTSEEIMLAIYDGLIPEGLKPAATHGVMHHLKKLRRDGRAKATADDKWFLVKGANVQSNI